MTDKEDCSHIILRKSLEKYLEMLIEVIADGLCMDVREERRKMAKLAAGVVTSAMQFESEERTVGSNERIIRCNCNREVIVRLLSGQYRDSYTGRCICKKGWLLESLSAG